MVDIPKTVPQENMKDSIFGVKQENDLQLILQEKYHLELNKTSYYCKFDFTSNDAIFEIKSRRCKSTQYPTTMIQQSKITKGLEHLDKGKQVYLVFNFTDKILVHTMKKDYNYTFSNGGRCDRGRPEFQQYCYLPISDCECIKIKENN